MKSEVDFSKVKAILGKYSNDPAKLIPILQDVQAAFRYLPEDLMAYIATELNVPPAKVFGVATFFSHFTLTPKGKHIVKICDGTACHVKKSEDIINALRAKCKIADGKITSEDGFITIETVSCLGACGLAPVVVVNDEIYGEMNVEKVNKLVEELK